MEEEDNRKRDGQGEKGEVDEVLSLINDGTLRQDFLKFACGHQATGEGEGAEDYLHGQHSHHERRNVGGAQIEFGSANQRDTKRAESVAERSPLRHSGHCHFAEGNADNGAEREADKDQLVINDATVEKGSDDGQGHT